MLRKEVDQNQVHQKMKADLKAAYAVSGLVFVVAFVSLVSLLWR